MLTMYGSILSAHVSSNLYLFDLNFLHLDPDQSTASDDTVELEARARVIGTMHEATTAESNTYLPFLCILIFFVLVSKSSVLEAKSTYQPFGIILSSLDFEKFIFLVWGRNEFFEADQCKFENCSPSPTKSNFTLRYCWR